MRGYLHIINIDRKVNSREGSDIDVNNLRNTFKEMCADVESTENPDENELDNIVRRILDKDFSQYLYVAIAFMSHGMDDDDVELADGEIIDFQKKFLIRLCNKKSLDGKLKLLIMQTCRGSYDFIGQKTEGGPGSTIPYDKYCAKFFATSEGMKAYRDVGTGSLFIYALCERFKSEYMTKDIISIFNNVRDDVRNKCINVYKTVPQIPSSEDNFGSKQFYISSGFQ